jgi:hypothetical protein
MYVKKHGSAQLKYADRTQMYSEKILSKSHFIYHKSHREWPWGSTGIFSTDLEYPNIKFHKDLSSES